MTTLVSINGVIHRPEDAKISVFDHGFLFGDSIYEVLRTYEGELFMFDAHLARLHQSAAYLSLTLPVSDRVLLNWCLEAVKAAANTESYVRLIITRGAGAISLNPATAAQPQVLFYVKPYEPYPAHLYREGCMATVSTVRRNDPKALNPSAKTGNYVNSMLALMEGLHFGATEAIMLNGEGLLTEGTTSNLCLVRDGVVHTPSADSGILQGITRTLVGEGCNLLGITLTHGRYPKNDLLTADEAFFCSTLKDVLPISRVYDVAQDRWTTVGNGGVGPVSARLSACWPEVVTALRRRFPPGHTVTE